MALPRLLCGPFDFARGRNYAAKQEAACRFTQRPCALPSEDYPRMTRMLLLRCCPLPAAPGVAACGAAACDAALRLFVVVSHAGVEKTARRRVLDIGVAPGEADGTAQTAHGTARHGTTEASRGAACCCVCSAGLSRFPPAISAIGSSTFARFMHQFHTSHFPPTPHFMRPSVSPLLARCPGLV